MKSDEGFEEFLQASQRLVERLQALQERLRARLEIMRELIKQNNALQASCSCATTFHCDCQDRSHPLHR